MAIYTKTPNGWEAIAQDAKAVSSFGSIVPDGNQTDEGSYTDADGREWVWYEWSTAGDYSVNLTGGLYWVLAVGGGAREYNNVKYEWSGQPGLVGEGLWEFGPGTHTVTVGAKGSGPGAASFGLPSSIGDYGTQGVVSWGTESTGRGATAGNDQTGYSSFITGVERQFAAGYDGADEPGRGSYRNTGHNDGCVIIATVVNGGKPKPVQPALTPATVVSAPVRVSGSADPIEWIVRQTDGTRKKIYMLPGNTAGGDENVFEVTLGAGVLPGVMVGSGGPGGYTNAGVFTTVGGGGSGGVIGQGAHVPVILPVQGTATYTVKVGSTSTFTNENDIYLYGQNTTIAVQGQTPFIAAIGGGGGMSYRGSQYIQPHQGASGGGGSIGSAEGTVNPYWSGAKGLPGQGNDGGMAVYGYAGGGGGYSAPGEGTAPPYIYGNSAGGAGFDLAAALNLDANDSLTGTFLDLVSVNGRIAGGGSAGAGVGVDGGGVAGGAAKDYTGGGGGSGDGYGGTGGCGVVYIITDA